MSQQSETTEDVSGESGATAGIVAEDQDGTQVEVAPDGCDSSETSKTNACQQPMSKNEMKRQKKKERWLETKVERRQAERVKRKKRLAEMRERGEDIGPSRKSLKKKKMVDSACRQRVVIDCSFDDFMTEKDSTFLVHQIQHSYATNRRADNPLQLYICGIGGKAKQRLDSIGDYRGWDIHKDERDFTEVFPKKEVVYLSSESPNVLDVLDDSKVYVIGGLVDHNCHKGLCHRLAEERGLSHAQLPIGQFLHLKSRKVLTINHVFEILLRFTETRDWQASLLAVLPQRKGVTCLKGDQAKTDPGQSQDTHKLHDSKDESNNREPVEEEKQEESASVVIMNGPVKPSRSGSGSDSSAAGMEVSVTGNTEDTESVVEKGEDVCSVGNCPTETNAGDALGDGDAGKEIPDVGDV